MDSSGLRLILLIAGIVLIVGIYGWDKIKRRLAGLKERGFKMPKKKAGTEALEPDYDPIDDDFADDGRREPSVVDWRDEDVDIDVSAPKEPRLDEAAAVDDARPAAPAARRTAEPSTPASAPSLPEVLVVHLAARVGASLSGDAIMAAARDGDLEPGQMDIFHRYADDGEAVLISMANMVKPGTFPFAQMSEFTTPGLALFAQLPGPLSPLQTYEALLDTAERLAAVLDARLQDERRRPLTRQARDRMRRRLGAAVE